MQSVLPEQFSEKCGEATDFLKLLANPNRLAVLCTLLQAPTNVTDLAKSTGLPQAAMSSQLAILREAKLIHCEINHRERIYSISDPRVEEMVGLLHKFFCEPQQDT
ncbi:MULTISPECIES: ArsR/SmtB family transcription factor [unclassified Acinetobacter]|uniref:ArsR/SmtB family transcription factor n=1 Tax=unclassified Acinetobacter TaxID=196816 RepID=UPI0035BB703D